VRTHLLHTAEVAHRWGAWEVSSALLIDVAQQYFPELRIVARARDVTHWRELRERGIVALERETFESALRVGRLVLEGLGVRAHEARERADVFRRHNLASLDALLPDWADESRRISSARAWREEFEQQFRKDLEELDLQSARGWHRADGD